MRAKNAFLFWELLLLISFPIFAEAGELSKVSLLAGNHQIVATIYQEGQGFGVNEVLSFRSSAGGKLLKTMTSDRFEKPVLFRYRGESFVHVSTTPAGSGGFVTDTIFWISPDSTMHEIEIENAAKIFEGMVDPQQTILGGGGLKYQGGELTFEFYIANNTDAHCCPTGDRVTGNYEIVGNKELDPITKQYRPAFKMVVKEYLKTPITGEMFANLAK